VLRGLSTARLSIEVEERRNATILRFACELDLATRPEADGIVQQAQAHAPQHLIFDLRALEFIDSTGLHLLLQAHLHSRNDGVTSLHVVCGADNVRHVIELAGLDKLISVIEDPAEALD
jgi:anti-sigma B factor antagonist